MRIFLTGATGFIGSRIVPELLEAGHQVLGMTRSDEGAQKLQAAGAEVHRGDLEDLDSMRKGATGVDAVIHCAFDHDFSNFVANTEKDRRVITAMADALVGSDRALVITSGVGIGAKTPGQPATEDYFDKDHPNPRKASEEAGHAALDRGVNVSVVRLPQVHDTEKQGLITPLIAMARKAGLIGYVGEGQNRYAAAAVLDVAKLYRLVVERAERGSVWNAVAEEGVPVRDIAEVLGAGLKIPVKSLSEEETRQVFGWMSAFAAMDISASSAYTQKTLNWKPTGPGLLEDLRKMDYFNI
ncbi:SDR family oxidoreductase [Terriglobus sp.]|uniref:SDR family oxidoreductase n=1 Tax=Terriglobus sp. TaxID=1889013 RepID=UPI003B002597